MTITVCNTWMELQQYSDQLDSLAQGASDPNVFYQRFLLVPALKYLVHTPASLVLVWSAQSSPQLIALFPFERRRSYHHLPLYHLRLLEYPHCFLCTPLIRSGYEYAALSELSDWAGRQSPRPAFINLTNCPRDSLFCAAIERYAAERHLRLSPGIPKPRALLQWEGTCEAYFARYSKKFWKNTRRKQRKLESLGNLEFQRLKEEESLESWIEEFLRIEASGWKGDTGTALGLSPANRLFTREALKEAFKCSALEFAKFALNGRTISMRICLRSQASRFLFKIAYDEEFNQCSPGVLLELEEMQQRLKAASRFYLDSCADPQNAFANSLFLEKREIATFRLSVPHPISRAAVSLVAAAEKIRERVRPAARHLHQDAGEELSE